MRHAIRFSQALCLSLLLPAAAAFGGPLVDLNRTQASVLARLSAQGTGFANDQLIRLTNVGTDPLAVISISVDNSGAFPLTNSCPGTLAPGEGCSLVVRYAIFSSVTTELSIATNAPGSPHTVTLDGFTPAFAGVSFPAATPGYLEFGNAFVGAPTAASQITITNRGNSPSNLTSITVGGRHPGDFAIAGSCHAGGVLASNAACTFDVTFMPTAAGPRSAEIYFIDAGYAPGTRFPLALVGYGLGAGARPTAQAIEFYHHDLDHYFLTHIANEIAKLDAGTEIKGWTRTGQAITVATASDAETSPVCRFYIPPALGNSHFYGRGTAECTSTGQRNPSFVNEDPQFFHMVLPLAGNCPAGTSAVYRVFSNRADANHRYMKDKAIRDEMVAKHWLAEGDGPDLVVMCAPA